MNISAVLDDFFCKESLGLDKIKYSHVNLNEKKHPRPVQKKINAYLMYIFMMVMLALTHFKAP